MSCVNIVFLSCWLGAKLPAKVAEVTKALVENYLAAKCTSFSSRRLRTAGLEIMSAHSMSLPYNVDEMPWELNSCLHQLA